jgi:signal transduction histidine kinase
VLDEIGDAAAKWRLRWLLALNVLVLTLLILRGESGTRGVVQLVTLAVMSGLFTARVLWPAWWNDLPLKTLSLVLGTACYFAVLATTGGLASPLLVIGVLMITTVAITVRQPRSLPAGVFLAFLVGFAGLALASRTAVGRLAPPLQPVGGWPSLEFVSISLLAVVFTMMGVYRVGCVMTRGYERAALELAERREELCSESEDRTRALEGMAARLAHELKNPLAAIKGLSTHMARNAADAKTSERLAIVAAEADRLQAIVESFLSFSRGLDDLKPAPTRLHEVARELSVLLETRAQEAGVTIDVTGDEVLVIESDARKVRQAMLNLVLNAIQASPRESTVAIGVAAEAGGARITVRDQGPGMSCEVLERIRKPYFTTKDSGTGLGVAVARGLIEQHGGQLEFKSAPGKGTTVIMHLPLRATTRAALPNPLRNSRAEGQESIQKVVAPPRSALIS